MIYSSDSDSPDLPHLKKDEVKILGHTEDFKVIFYYLKKKLC